MKKQANRRIVDSKSPSKKRRKSTELAAQSEKRVDPEGGLEKVPKQNEEKVPEQNEDILIN